MSFNSRWLRQLLVANRCFEVENGRLEVDNRRLEVEARRLDVKNRRLEVKNGRLEVEKLAAWTACGGQIGGLREKLGGLK
jgi:hypothetical protein